MEKSTFYVVFWLIGFLLGGLVGHIWFDGFHPACWIGLIIALALSAGDADILDDIADTFHH
ncbi:MAG TPA: hypothetical protein VFM18_15035 [Methanosarcina sp.]|nr:hypothetical protein [Methanosarcina sp.]